MGLFNSLKLEKENLENDILQLQKEREIIKSELTNLAKEKNNIANDINTLSAQKSDIDKQLVFREDFFVNTELKYIDTLSGLEFENYFAALLNKLGYTTTVTKPTQDNGVDILAEKDNVSYVFQCKNYSSSVGNKAVQEVYTAQGIFKTDVSIVITNNYYTAQAQKEASILNVELWDRDKLRLLLCDSYKFDLSHIDYIYSKTTIHTNDYYEEDDDDDIDPLLMDAIETVVETGQASTSFIQRRFKVGYTRACTIIDQMEERGIISGYQGSKPRDVLMTKEKWQELINNT